MPALARFPGFARLQETPGFADIHRGSRHDGGRDSTAPTCEDRMGLDRRELLKLAGAGCLAAALPTGAAEAGILHPAPVGVHGQMTGAEALVETLAQEGTECVFGIPGAQENELWDTMKSRHLGYLLVTHEFS